MLGKTWLGDHQQLKLAPVKTNPGKKGEPPGQGKKGGGSGGSGSDPAIALVYFLTRWSNTSGNQDTPIVRKETTVISANGTSTISTGNTKWPAAGSTNYATTGNNAHGDVAGLSDPELGSGDFAVEYWAKPTTLTTGSYLSQMVFGNMGSIGLRIRTLSDGTIQLFTSNAHPVPATIAITSSSGVITINNYHWVQLRRISGTTTLAVNGSQVGGNFTDAGNYTNGAWWILGDNNETLGFQGYSGEIRYTKGTSGALAGKRPIFLPTGPLPIT